MWLVCLLFRFCNCAECQPATFCVSEFFITVFLHSRRHHICIEFKLNNFCCRLPRQTTERCVLFFCRNVETLESAVSLYRQMRHFWAPNSEIFEHQDDRINMQLILSGIRKRLSMYGDKSFRRHCRRHGRRFDKISFSCKPSERLGTQTLLSILSFIVHIC